MFFSFPHIGIDSKGVVGNISRPGRAGMSCACGAVIKVRLQGSHVVLVHTQQALQEPRRRSFPVFVRWGDFGSSVLCHSGRATAGAPCLQALGDIKSEGLQCNCKEPGGECRWHSAAFVFFAGSSILLLQSG